MLVQQRKREGSSIVETAAGLILLIPIVLFLVDVAAMVVVQTENDKLAKACARAAAEYPANDPKAVTAAQNVYNNQKNSNLLKTATFSTSSGAPTYLAPGMVTCKTTITCTLPVPVPLVGNSQVNFNAVATEPIVGELP
jgi:Flp pilus assembly protein TadG